MKLPLDTVDKFFMIFLSAVLLCFVSLVVCVVHDYITHGCRYQEQVITLKEK